MYQVEISAPAKKNLKKVDVRYQKAIIKALQKIASNPLSGDQLKGEFKGLWKLRVSKYRIIYLIENKKLKVIIIAIRHRRDVYKRI